MHAGTGVATLWWTDSNAWRQLQLSSERGRMIVLTLTGTMIAATPDMLG